MLEETVKINSDGTRVVKYKKILPNGTASKIKTSTLFPETRSDADIINSVKQIGDTPSNRNQNGRQGNYSFRTCK